MTNFQLYFGQAVKNSKNDQLIEMSIEALISRIIEPDPQLSSLVSRLRVISSIDKRKYAEMKTSLPYFIPASFTGNIRNAQNFEKSTGFVIDLDDLPSAGLDPDKVFETLRNDARIIMLFRSPGGYGLKALFGFQQPILDTRIYTAFYKTFTLRFAREYQLEKVVDTSTSDAMRICFLSADPGAYCNINATKVIPGEYIADSILEPIEPEDMDSLKVNRIDNNSTNQKEIKQRDITGEVMREISKMLAANPKSIREPKNYYVPAELDRLEAVLESVLGGTNITIGLVNPIQYGKQVRFNNGDRFAEINFFYGKRGYSFVHTTRSGYDKVLMDELLRILGGAVWSRELYAVVC